MTGEVQYINLCTCSCQAMLCFLNVNQIRILGQNLVKFPKSDNAAANVPSDVSALFREGVRTDRRT